MDSSDEGEHDSENDNDNDNDNLNDDIDIDNDNENDFQGGEGNAEDIEGGGVTHDAGPEPSSVSKVCHSTFLIARI